MTGRASGTGRQKAISNRQSTRSSERLRSLDSFDPLSADMAATAKQIQEVKDSLTALINAKVEHLEHVVQDKNKIIADLQKRLTAVENQLKSAVANNVKLVSDNAALEAKLDVRLDDLQQHGRKPNLRIEGIAYRANETNAELQQKVVTALNNMQADIDDLDINRLHRSSKPRKDRDTGVLVAQTIVNFRSWGARQRAYKAKFYSKEHRMQEHIVVDLTKRRLDLLNKARTDLGKKHPYAHAFADQECRLAIKIRTLDEKIFFNTEDELAAALARVPPVPVAVVDDDHPEFDDDHPEIVENVDDA